MSNVAEAPAKLPAKPVSWLRENLEAVVVAVILALLIRQYATEAFVIPTGSMAPTLLGAHVDLICTNCGKPQPVSDGIFARAAAGASAAQGNAHGKCPKCGKEHWTTLPDDAFTAGKAEIECDRCHAKVPMSIVQVPLGSGDKEVEAICSNCGTHFKNRVSSGLWPFGSVSRGDRILVDKFSYKFTRPERFSVIVFKYPVKPSDNYIKRLIGLPGDEIDVKNGHIYANGKIARKPADVRAECWIPVFESRYVEKDPGGDDFGEGRARALREEGGLFAPTPDKKGFILKKSLGADPAWLVYNREIKDWNAYNETNSFTRGGRELEGDLRVAFDVTLGAPGVVALARLSDDEAEFQVEVSDGKAVIRRGAEEVASLPVRFPILKSHKIDFGRADGLVTLDIDGARVLAHEYDPQDEGPTKRSEVRIGVKGGDYATFHEVSVYRAVYYLPRIMGAAAHLFPYHVPEGQYFCMGDNSSNSTDSRVWGTVPEGYIVGRAFLVFWPAIPGDFAVRRIR